MTKRTEQEEFWAGPFGDDYIDRNDDLDVVASNIALFARALRRASGVGSAIEFGANIGLNLRALRALLPQAELSAIEINTRAVALLRKNAPDVAVFEGSLFEFEPPREWDLSFTKGVLIHIDPERLPAAYDQLFTASRDYILLCEYYNPTPVEVRYRGYEARLFKRDFAGEMLERFPGLRLVDYGFVYRRDAPFRQDDLTWFLLRKRP